MTFCELRKTIQLAGSEFGVAISGNRAKQLAASLLTQDADYSNLTYPDPTGERAVMRAVADMLTREDRT